MKVREMAEALNLEQITSSPEDKEITGVYACDLLSRVMSSCGFGNAWITVQTHLNVLAVAELNEVSCIIVPEGIDVNPTTVEKALEKEIAVLTSDLTAYELCWKMHELLM